MLRADLATADLDSVSLLKGDKSSRPSMIFAVLPAVVQNRLPTLPSLRHSISEIRERGFHIRTSLAAEHSTPETPPPGYTPRAGSGSVTPSRQSIVSTETEYDFPDNISERPDTSTGLGTPLFGSYETKTGINWKYASSGISLMTQACRESSVQALTTDETSTNLTRQLYIHGMTYLLRGLPSQLTPEEILSLQAAIPQNILTVQSDPSTHAMIPASSRAQSSQEIRAQETTILHRITAMLVFQTFMFIQFLLPYIKLFMGHAYRFEREHKLTQRLMSTSVSTADELTRRGLRLSQTICQMNNGKVGQTINEVVVWWARGLTGGMQQGIEEAWGVAGEGRKMEERRGIES